MDKIVIENFRCFRTLQEVPLAPLTLLVGENSTGKTSFLAAIRIAASLQNMGMFPDFNEEPFALGAYEQIANYSAGRAGRAESFTIGYEDSFLLGRRQGGTQSTKVLATFCQHGVQPQISEWRLVSQKYCIVISYTPSGEKVDLTVETPADVGLQKNVFLLVSRCRLITSLTLFFANLTEGDAMTAIRAQRILQNKTWRTFKSLSCKWYSRLSLAHTQ